MPADLRAQILIYLTEELSVDRDQAKAVPVSEHDRGQEGKRILSPESFSVYRASELLRWTRFWQVGSNGRFPIGEYAMQPSGCFGLRTNQVLLLADVGVQVVEFESLNEWKRYEQLGFPAARIRCV